jgi:hypothetical protein
MRDERQRAELLAAALHNVLALLERA